MTRVLGLSLALVLALSMAAWAGEASGKVQSVNAGDRTIVLDDGTKLYVAEGLSIDGLKEGAKVTASFEEREGKNVVTSIEVAD